MEKLRTIFNMRMESFMREHFPVGSKWLHPRRDESFIVLGYMLSDVTPSWYKNGPVEFMESMCIVRPTAICSGWSEEEGSYTNRQSEIEHFDFGALSQLVPLDNDGSDLFELNKKMNPDSTVLQAEQIIAAI